MGLIEGGGRQLILELNDGSQEPFDPESLRIGDRDVPYTRVKNGEFPARFSRPAYYQLARFIVSDDEQREFFLLLDGKRIPIKR
jgi:hypothetical protein